MNRQRCNNVSHKNWSTKQVTRPKHMMHVFSLINKRPKFVFSQHFRKQPRFVSASDHQKKWIVCVAHFAIHLDAGKIVCPNRQNHINGRQTIRPSAWELARFQSSISDVSRCLNHAACKCARRR